MKPLVAGLDTIGKTVIHYVEETGRIMLLFSSILFWMFRPPIKWWNILKQMEFVGVKSIFVVVLTGTLTPRSANVSGTRSCGVAFWNPQAESAWTTWPSTTG